MSERLIKIIFLLLNKTIKMNSQQQNDIIQRDDLMIIFSEALSKSSHNIKNIKNYRKLHHDVLKRNDGFPNTTTECTNQQRYVWTIDNSERIVQHQSQERMKLNLDGLPMRRASVTAGNSRKRNQEVLKTHARTLNLSNNITMRDPTTSLKKRQVKENKFSYIQKKYNKGPLKDKYLSSWLNSLLMEACHEEKFDSTIENPALKKYGLDQNSLRSKGIRPENLSRIYKSLFVYSIGFNDLLRQICDKNMNLRKTIWKVFAILLEYCAQGDFQTMIAEIERDKLEKIQNLTNQILKRQKIIQNSQQINQMKNVKIYKEIKQLREENQNLINQKGVLLEQFKQAEQAFNQQVALRLKYENKINQIHGVYVEIENKHMRLVNDYEVNLKEVEKLRAMTTQQVKISTELKKDNQAKSQEIIALQKSLKYKIQLIAQMENKKHGDANLNIQNINNIKQLKMIIEEKQRQIGQLNLSIKNLNVFLDTEKEEHQRTSQSFAQSLQENSRLHGTIQQQMKDLNQLLYEKRNFGMETSNIQAEIILLQGRLDEKLKQNKQLARTLESERDQLIKSRASIETQKKLRVQLEEDLKICYTNIKEMKTAKNQIEEQNNERKRKMENIDEIIAGKQSLINQQKIQIENFVNQISSAKLLIKNLQSKLEMLNQKMKSDEEIYNKKIQVLKNDRDLIEKQFLQFDYVKKILEFQRDRYRSQFEEKDLGYKNEKFEKIQLQGFYDFSLKAGQEKNDEIRRLDIKISELNEEIASHKRKIRSMEYLSEQRQKRLAKEKQFWTQKLESLSKQNKQRRFYVHPFIYEDVCENFRIKSQKLEELQKTSALKIKNLTDQLKQKDQALKQLKQKQEQQLLILSNKYDKIIQKKDNEILYETNKNAHLSQKIKQLQYNLIKLTGQGKEMSFEREQKYLVDIKQKKQQIQVLLKDLEKAHDLNKNLRESYLNYEKQIPAKQKQLAQLKQQVVENKAKYEEVLVIKQKQIQQKVEQIEKLKQSQTQQKKQLMKDKSRPLSKSTGKKNERTQDMREELIFGGGSDTKRNDFVRKYKGAYIYYTK